MKLKDLKLSSREMLLDISAMRERSKTLLNQGKEYDQLLRYLISLNYFYDEEVRLPSIREISEATGIEYSKVRKYIRQIYVDLVLRHYVNEDEFNASFSFGSVRYTVSISGRDGRYMYMEVDELPVIPRVGENVEIPYFKAYLDDRNFHVKSIEHRLNDRGQEIHISVRPGRFNIYFDYLKEKAYEKGDLSIHDYFDLDDWAISGKLRIGMWGRF